MVKHCKTCRTFYYVIERVHEYMVLESFFRIFQAEIYKIITCPDEIFRLRIHGEEIFLYLVVSMICKGRLSIQFIATDAWR